MRAGRGLRVECECTKLAKAVRKLVPQGTPVMFALDCCRSEAKTGPRPGKINPDGQQPHDVAFLWATTVGYYAHDYNGGRDCMSTILAKELNRRLNELPVGDSVIEWGALKTDLLSRLMADFDGGTDVDLSSLAKHFCFRKKGDKEPPPVPELPTAATPLGQLLAQMRVHKEDADVAYAGTKELLRRAKEGDELVEKGAVDAVVSAISIHTDDLLVCERGCKALVEMGSPEGHSTAKMGSPKDHSAAFTAAGAPKAVVKVLTAHMDNDICKWGCEALAGMCYGDDASIAAAVAENAPQVVVEALKRHSQELDVCMAGCAALRKYSKCDVGVKACIAVGAPLELAAALTNFCGGEGDEEVCCDEGHEEVCCKAEGVCKASDALSFIARSSLEGREAVKACAVAPLLKALARYSAHTRPCLHAHTRPCLHSALKELGYFGAGKELPSEEMGAERVVALMNACDEEVGEAVAFVGVDMLLAICKTSDGVGKFWDARALSTVSSNLNSTPTHLPCVQPPRSYSRSSPRETSSSADRT